MTDYFKAHKRLTRNTVETIVNPAGKETQQLHGSSWKTTKKCNRDGFRLATLNACDVLFLVVVSAEVCRGRGVLYQNSKA